MIPGVRFHIIMRKIKHIYGHLKVAMKSDEIIHLLFHRKEGELWFLFIYYDRITMYKVQGTCIIHVPEGIYVIIMTFYKAP